MAKRSRNNSVVPMCLRIIIIIYFLSFVLGIFSFIGAHFMKDVDILGAFAGNLAIFLLSICVTNFFVGFGLWTGFNWARIMAIIVSCLNIILGVLLIVRESGFLRVFRGLLLT